MTDEPKKAEKPAAGTETELTKEETAKAWGDNPTLGNEITPSDVLKQQEKKK